MKTLNQIKNWEELKNQVVCGDCLEGMKLIPDKSIDLVLTDPPYKVGAKGCGLAGNRAYLKDITEADIADGFDFGILEECLRVLKNPNIIIFCGKQQLFEYMQWVHKKGFKWQLITWNKTNPTPLTNNNYLPDTEYIFHIWENRKLTGEYKDKAKFYLSTVEKNRFSHPTVKPINLIQKFLKVGSSENNLILDPFMGSWTTARACKDLGRGFIGFEISEKYCKIGESRLEQQNLF